MQMREIFSVRYNAWLKSTPASFPSVDGGKFNHESVGGKTFHRNSGAFVSAPRDVIWFSSISLIRKRRQGAKMFRWTYFAFPPIASIILWSEIHLRRTLWSFRSQTTNSMFGLQAPPKNVSDTAHSWTSTHIGWFDANHWRSFTSTATAHDWNWIQPNIYTKFLFRALEIRDASWSNAKRHICLVEAIDWRVKLALKAFHPNESIINVEALMDINDSAFLLLIWKDFLSGKLLGGKNFMTLHTMCDASSSIKVQTSCLV